MIGGDAVKPGAELAFALEGAELSDGFDEHFLGGFLGVVRLENHANRYVVDPRLMPQNQLFQRGAVAVLGLLDQIGIRLIALGDLGEGVEHDSAPWSKGIDILDGWNNVPSLGHDGMASVTTLGTGFPGQSI